MGVCKVRERESLELSYRKVRADQWSSQNSHWMLDKTCINPQRAWSTEWKDDSSWERSEQADLSLDWSNIRAEFQIARRHQTIW